MPYFEGPSSKASAVCIPGLYQFSMEVNSIFLAITSALVTILQTHSSAKYTVYPEQRCQKCGNIVWAIIVICNKNFHTSGVFHPFLKRSADIPDPSQHPRWQVSGAVRTSLAQGSKLLAEILYQCSGGVLVLFSEEVNLDTEHGVVLNRPESFMLGPSFHSILKNLGTISALFSHSLSK